jgi:hypothetical protein
MILYFSDLDGDVSFAIYAEDPSKTKKIINFLSQVYGREFEQIKNDWADDYIIEKSTLILKVNLFNEDILDITEKGVDLLIVK